MIFYILVVFLILLPGCKSVKIDKEFSKLKKTTKKITGSPIAYTASQPINTNEYDAQLTQGLSRNEAIGIALKNTPGLQAEFENLGVAKADLVQAGLYTNPNINSLFRFPTKDPGTGTAEINIESVAAFRLADLWQIPFSKKVAEDLLEIMTLRILSGILDLVKEATMAYNACLHAQAHLENAQTTLQETVAFRERVYHRKNYGYSSDLDLYNADIMVNSIELEVIQYSMMLRTSYIHLKMVLGLDPTRSDVCTTEDFYKAIEVPELVPLEHYALNNRPEMQIAHLRIKQYKDSVSLEKAKVWNNFNVGVAFKQDFEKPFRGWGPYFSVDLPVFDPNHAQIARAKFLYKQAKKQLRATEIKVKEELRKPYENLRGLTEEIAVYTNNLFPNHKKAIAWADKYAGSMQINRLLPMQTKIELYETNKRYIDTKFHLLQEFAELERAVGKRLDGSHAATIDTSCLANNSINHS